MQFSLNQVIIGGFALVGAVVAATWNVRNDRIEELSSVVDGYERSEKWKLPETIKRIETASSHLDGQIIFILDNKKLKEDLEKVKIDFHQKEAEIESIKSFHEKKVGELKKQLSELSEKLKQKNDFISSLYSEASEFSLTKSTSKKIFGLDVVVSVTDIVLNDYAEIIVNNKSWRMYPGNIVGVSYKDEGCKLLLNQISNYKLVDFTFVCDK